MIVSCQRSVAKFPVSGPWPSGALGRRRVADFRAYGRVITRQATRLLRPYRTLEQSSSRTRCEKPAPWNVGCLVADRNNVDHSMRRKRCCTPETSKHVIVVQTQRSGSGRYSDDPDSS